MQTATGTVTQTVDILSCAPPGIKLRDVQKDYLKWVETNYDNYDVFVCVAPTASGKSISLMSLSEWLTASNLGSSCAIVPNKMLQDQYAKDFNDLLIVKGASNYHCNDIDATCEIYRKLHKKCCGGADKCPYIATIAAAKVADLALFNYHIYTPLKMSKPNLICDESHTSIPFLYSLFSVNLWQCEENYSDELGTDPKAISEWISSKWLTNAVMDLSMLMAKGADSREAKEMEEKIQKMKDVALGLLSYPTDFIIENKVDKYWKSKVYKNQQVKGTQQNFLYIKPLKIDKMGKNTLWPPAVKKIFFLSATISPKDVEILGLNDRRVGYFECDSPIPAENRPFVRWPIANMSYATRKEGIPKIVEAIKKLANKHKDEKGLVHCTYETAKALKESLGGMRYLFHTDKDKAEVYKKFREAKGPVILIASGMAEGIDLPDDAARWQVITQVMFPYLGDSVNKWISQNDTERYKTMTIQVIEQQSGRIVRHPLDKGVTYCLDSQFSRLYKETHTDRIEAGEKSLWHQWFINGVRV